MSPRSGEGKPALVTPWRGGHNGGMEMPPPVAAPRLDPPRFQALRAIVALMLREMGSTYGRSPGGYAWAVLEPLGVIALLSVGFSLLVRTPSLGTSFILFYATGFLPFDLYGDIATKTAASMRYSGALMAYPRVTWLDAVLARVILNTLVGLTVFCLLITAILLVVDARTVLDPIPVLTGLTLAVALGLGVGLVNCVLNAFYPIWSQFWTIISRPLFLASGVLFIYENMPDLAQRILWWNPVLHATAITRSGFYPNYHASFVSLPYAFGVALVLIALGLLLMRRHHKAVLEI